MGKRGGHALYRGQRKERRERRRGTCAAACRPCHLRVGADARPNRHSTKQLGTSCSRSDAASLTTPKFVRLPYRTRCFAETQIFLQSPGVRSAGNRPGTENANALTLESSEAKSRCCS